MLPRLRAPRYGEAAHPEWITLWGPVIAYMAMVFGLSSLSKLPAPPAGLSFYDVHVVTYAGLGALTARATLRQALGRLELSRVTTGHGLRRAPWRAVLGAIVISTLYGVSDEYHQMFVPGRTFDVLDIVADAIGSVAGAIAVGSWSKIRHW